MTRQKKSEVELHPNGWRRFERAMAVVVKSPPQHRVKAKAKPTATMKRRARKKS